MLLLKSNGLNGPIQQKFVYPFLLSNKFRVVCTIIPIFLGLYLENQRCFYWRSSSKVFSWLPWIGLFWWILHLNIFWLPFRSLKTCWDDLIPTEFHFDSPRIFHLHISPEMAFMSTGVSEYVHPVIDSELAGKRQKDSSESYVNFIVSSNRVWGLIFGFSIAMS